MKAIKIVWVTVALLISAYLPVYSVADSTVSVNVDTLPSTGTYYIISASSNEALQPNAPTLGQTVFLSEFNKGGTQKWKINRKIDPATNKPTNRYSIRLAGDNEELNFNPHPSVGDASPVLGLDKSIFVLEPSQEGVLVKSVEKNGDAMYAHASSEPAPLFGPNDGSNKFRWNFVSAD